jgi:hypothetical protein
MHSNNTTHKAKTNDLALSVAATMLPPTCVCSVTRAAEIPNSEDLLDLDRAEA